MSTLLGKIWSSCSSRVLSEKNCFVMFCGAFSFPPGFYVWTLNLIANDILKAIYVRFCILVRFGKLSGHLLGNSCSLGLRCFLSIST